MIDSYRLTSRTMRNSCLPVAVWALALVAAAPALAEGIGELRGLGPAPTGLAASAFLTNDPLRDSVRRLDAVSVSLRPAAGGALAAWRPLSASERGQPTPVDADLFPHTRQAVPLLVPDAGDVTSSLLSAPSRAMTGPSVGVRWRIPGHTR
jgi:hypothetical protein